MNVARSGFRHVRLCNDCKQEIDGDGRCGCPHESPWRKGIAVTICADADGQRPIALAAVARIGNGQFRIEGAPRWFSMVTGESTHGDYGWARLRKEGDERLVAEHEVAKRKREKRAADLGQLKTSRASYLADAKRYMAEAARMATEASHHEKRAESYRKAEKERAAQAESMAANAARVSVEIEAMERDA